MFKKVLSLSGLEKITKEAQKSISGGAFPSTSRGCCDPTFHCCTTNPAPAQCSGVAYGGASCRFLYSSGCCV